jgi:hypothetical protein
MLCRQPYKNIPGQVPRYKRPEMIRRIKQYRNEEARDMTANERAQQTGLKKYICCWLNKVFQKIQTAGTN